MRAAVPFRRSLVVRLLAASFLIAACAIAATAWLASSTTRNALARQQGQTLATDTDIVAQLSGYAAVHKDWTGVGPLLRQLSARDTPRIELVGADGKPVAGIGSGALSQTPTATVDPLSFDTFTTPGAQRPGIDPRAVGPYLLTADESQHLKDLADRKAVCISAQGIQVQAVRSPAGRYSVSTAVVLPRKASDVCTSLDLDVTMPSELKPLNQLETDTAICLQRQGAQAPQDLVISPDFQLLIYPAPTRQAEQGEQCLMSARRAQLRPFVAPPVQLYLGTGTAAGWRFNLSGPNRAKIAWTAALVLAVTVAVTALLGLRLIRPLRALIHTARQDPGDFARAPVTTRDETGYLAIAFNQLTERRQQMDEQRKALVADIAHELRTPLTNIRGWLEVTRDGLVAPTPQLIASLHEEAVVLQRVIDDLQDLASADAGTLRIHPKPVLADDLLQQAAAAHQAQTTAAGITVTAEAEEALRIVADPDRIRQVLGNLLSNAVRHTPSGGRITLKATTETDAAVLSVEDTGCGIAADDLPHIFDRFWRSEKSRNRSTGGSGLGLAIAQHLVQAHGGTIDADSTPGVGTTVMVRLPLAQDHRL